MNLAERYYTEAASNIYLSQGLMDNILDMTSSEILEFFNYEDSRISSFISNACRYFSTKSHNELMTRWLEKTDLTSRGPIASAIQSCASRMSTNSGKIQEFFDDTKNWICSNWPTPDCDQWNFTVEFV